MAISQALTIATTHVPDVAAIRADLEATQAAYQQLLGAIDEADLERPCAISKWTIKQVLTHLVVNLEQAVPMMVAQARKSQPMPKLLDTQQCSVCSAIREDSDGTRWFCDDHRVKQNAVSPMTVWTHGSVLE